MNQHPQNSAGDKILTFVNSGFTTLSTACFPKSSINWRRQTQNSQTWKIHLPQGFFFMGIPNNHQNTMYKCWKSTFKGWSNFTACAYICWQAIPRPPFGTLNFHIYSYSDSREPEIIIHFSRNVEHLLSYLICIRG